MTDQQLIKYAKRYLDDLSHESKHRRILAAVAHHDANGDPNKPFLLHAARVALAELEPETVAELETVATPEQTRKERLIAEAEAHRNYRGVTTEKHSLAVCVGMVPRPV